MTTNQLTLTNHVNLRMGFQHMLTNGWITTKELLKSRRVCKAFKQAIDELLDKNGKLKNAGMEYSSFKTIALKASMTLFGKLNAIVVNLKAVYDSLNMPQLPSQPAGGETLDHARSLYSLRFETYEPIIDSIIKDPELQQVDKLIDNINYAMWVPEKKSFIIVFEDLLKAIDKCKMYMQIAEYKLLGDK